MRKLAWGFVVLAIAACDSDVETDDGSGGAGGAPSTTTGSTKSSSTGGSPTSSSSGMTTSSSNGSTTVATTGSTTSATTGSTTSATTSASTSVASTSVASSSASTSSSSSSSTGTGGGPTIDTCAELCVAIDPYNQALGCMPVGDCDTDCNDFISQTNCETEYFLFVDCALQLPTSAFECDPGGGGLVYLGPGCETELDAFFVCFNP